MDLIIPTYGRAFNQSTLATLMVAGFNPTLVVQAREATKYESRPRVVVLPPDITTIAPTRQFILDKVGEDETFIMFDDDLVFYARRDDDPTKFREMEPGDYHEMMGSLKSHLNGFAHVGIASREGGNRNTERFIQNTRIMRVLGYDRKILRRNNIRFDAMEVMEDFHVALTLLELGYDNTVLNSWCHNQAGSGKDGGCSHFRTPELQARNAHLLAKLHPGFVQVVQKSTKTAWGGGTRTDVIVQWKKAFQSSTR